MGEAEKEKLICALSYLWILFFLPLVLLPNSQNGKYHANQALLNLIIMAACSIVSAIVVWIPILGAIISALLGLFGLACTVWGIYHAVIGVQRPYPIIGGITFIK